MSFQQELPAHALPTHTLTSWIADADSFVGSNRLKAFLPIQRDAITPSPEQSISGRQ
jgi:hypothetical protein